MFMNNQFQILAAALLKGLSSFHAERVAEMWSAITRRGTPVNCTGRLR